MTGSLKFFGSLSSMGGEFKIVIKIRCVKIHLIFFGSLSDIGEVRNRTVFLGGSIRKIKKSVQEEVIMKKKLPVDQNLIWEDTIIKK